jgi:hypothetical protein
MGRPIGRSCYQYRGDLVLSHEEPEHALLDDSDVLWPPWFDDFPVGRHGQPIQGQISVGPEAFEMVYEQLMKPEK